MFCFFRFSSIALCLALCSTQSAFAFASDVVSSEPRFCADMLASVFHPETGEEVIARDLCEYNDLLQQGYLPEKPVLCAQAFGYVRNPSSGVALTYRNSCELEAFLKAGYILLLRNP